MACTRHRVDGMSTVPVVTGCVPQVASIVCIAAGHGVCTSALHTCSTVQHTRQRRDRKVLNLFQLLVPVLCPQFIGAIYVSTARGVSPHEPRRVFLDAADPANLVMRVPQSVDDDDKVVSYYSWSRSEPLCSTYVHISTVPVVQCPPRCLVLNSYIRSIPFTLFPFSELCVSGTRQP